MQNQPIIPFSSESEKYILGSLMIEPNLANEYCPRLVTNDFYNEINKKVFDAICQVHKDNKEVDISTVIEQLKAAKQYEAVGGDAYLLELIESIPTYASIESYVEILKQKSIERELYWTVTNLSRKIIAGRDPFKKLLETAETEIMRIVNRQQTTPFKEIRLATEEVLQIIEENHNKEGSDLIGKPTGFEELDKVTHGFKPGELIILGARPGVGKSAFALNVASRMSEISDCSVAFFSLEMGIDQLVMRLLSSYSGVKLDNIISGKMSEAEMGKLYRARTALNNHNIYLDESTTSNLEDIKLKCRKLSRENKLDFVVIDYLQLMSVQGRSRNEEVSIISRGLKLLARELKIPVLALSQLSRNIDKRNEDEGKKPILSDLRESGSIEQDADIVLFLHREAKKNEGETRFVNAKTELIVAKNRQGMTKSINLVFRGDCSTFIPVKKENV